MLAKDCGRNISKFRLFCCLFIDINFVEVIENYNMQI